MVQRLAGLLIQGQCRGREGGHRDCYGGGARRCFWRAFDLPGSAAHGADVRVLETSQFYIADATALLTQNPMAVLYIATVLAHRLDGANHTLVQLKHQLESGEPHSVVIISFA